MATARVFKSGNSQAVRLPKKFRVNSKELEISRRGDEIVLREKSKGLERVSEILADMPDDMFPEATEIDTHRSDARVIVSPRFLIDTDILIYLRQRRSLQVTARFRAVRAGDAAMSVITHGELLYGAEREPGARALAKVDQRPQRH